VVDLRLLSTWLWHHPEHPEDLEDMVLAAHRDKNVEGRIADFAVRHPDPDFKHAARRLLTEVFQGPSR